MPHIERRRNLWYATLTIPTKARPRLGDKFKFIQSLGTPDKRQAQTLAAPLIAKWQAQIRQALGDGDAVVREALRWHALLAEAKPSDDNDDLRAAGYEEARDHVVELAKQIEREADYTTAKRFADIALGVVVPSDAHFDAWHAALKLAPKTKDQMRKDVTELVKRFPTLQEISHQTVKRWLDDLATAHVSPISRERIMCSCRSYWRYLQEKDAVPSDSQPFIRLAGNKARKQRSNGGSWEPFRPADVVKLWKEAHKRDDAPLADLIMLGAYTGARIEELCSLKLEDVAKTSCKITDAKTAAGDREVPIHSQLRKLVQRLKHNSKDGYLLTGLTFNKYGDRSNAIGKRFGRLKASLGYGENHVFHSIRKTLVTLLENAGISENLAADIVGHEKPRITYGLYSGGATLSVKAEAIERVKYPGFKL